MRIGPRGLVGGSLYAAALAGLVVAGAGAVALAAGTGLWGVKRLLFVAGFALLGVAALQWRPAPAWTGGERDGPGATWLARRVGGRLGGEVVPVAPARAGAAVLVLAASLLLEAVGV